MIKGRKVSNIFPISERISEEAKKFFELAKAAKRILISSTLTSDGDSIGGQLGLLYLLEKVRGSDGIWIVDESPVPDRYAFLAGSEKVLSYAQWKELTQKPSFDLGVVCDGGVERTGEVEEIFKSIPKRVLVDHHSVGSKLSYDASILDVECSSTCELVYHLLEIADLPLTKEVAEALFVGIVFDTGFFKHSLTKPRTHHVAAELIATGIDFSKISDRAILERTWQAQLLLKAMLQNIRRSANGKIVSSHWSSAELNEINPKDGDQEGMINQLYYTDGAEVVVLFSEKDDHEVKISFRSKGKVNVAEFARTLNPNGGGHIRAAGCTMKGSLSEVENTVLEKLAKLV